MGFRKVKMSLDAKLRPLDQFGFSSQFFFLALLGIAANMFVIIGVMMILETGTNAFADIYMLVILGVNQVIILLIEKICLYLRRKLKIWENGQTVTEEGRQLSDIVKSTSPVKDSKKTMRQQALEEASDFKKGEE